MSRLPRKPRIFHVTLWFAVATVMMSLAAGCRKSEPTAPPANATTQAAKQPPVLPSGPERRLITQLIKTLHDDTNPIARASAAEQLGRLKQKAAAATEPLIKALDDPEVSVRIEAATALGWIGPQAAAAAEPLMELLDDDSVALRSHAAFSLGQIRSEAAKAAAPKLIRMVWTDEHVDVQRRAATALGHLGLGTPEAAPTLIHATEHKDARVRNEAVLGLKNLGAEAAAAGKALVHVLRNDPDQRVRKHAALTLGRINPTDRTLAIEGLIDGVGDSYSKTRWESLLSLRNFGADAAKATPAILGAMDDPDIKIRETAVPALLKAIGAAAVPYLKGIVYDKQSPHQARAATALGMLGVSSPAIINALTDALEDTNEAVVVAAAGALGSLGRDAFSAAPLLTEMIQDPREAVSEAAKTALQRQLQPRAISQP